MRIFGRKKTLIIGALIVCLISVTTTYSQTDTSGSGEPSFYWKERGVALGNNWGLTSFQELGYYLGREVTLSEKITMLGLTNYGVEFNFGGADPIVAPKIEMRGFIKMFNVGVSFMYLTRISGVNKAVVIRPKFGFGRSNFCVTYGRNYLMYNDGLNNLGVHVLSISYFMKTERFKREKTN